jgi:hypothetical protein
MAVIIESSYGKTIGLPGYSSHKFCLSVKTEVADLSQVGAEAERVYQIMQTAVDAQMAQPGWMPNGGNGNGHASTPAPTTSAAANGHGANGGSANGGNGNSHSANGGNGANGNGAHSVPSDRQPWNCSPKQRTLIEDLVRDNNLNLADIADLANKRFGKELGALNKLEASGLIDELLDTYGKRQQGAGRRQYQPRQTAGSGRRGT